MNIPNKKLTSKKLKQTKELEIIPIYLSSVMINPSSGGLMVLASKGDKKEVAIPLSSGDGSTISFIHTGLSDDAHIQTIHQMYLRLLKDISIKIESVNLESRVGDVIYASIKFVDKNHKRYWALCSVADGVALSLLSKAPLGAVKMLWDDLEDFNDWPYEKHIISFGDDE